MNMKNKVMMYLLGLFIMGMGFLCYLYQYYYWVPGTWWEPGYTVTVIPYRDLGLPLIFIGIAIMITWIIVDCLGWLDK